MADVEEPVEDTPVEEVAAEEEEEDFVAVGGATEVKLFGKWSFDDIEVRDISLVVSLLVDYKIDPPWLMMKTRMSIVCMVCRFSRRQNLIKLSLSFCRLRITLPARETMPLTFPTRPADTRRSDSARHHAPL